MGAPFLRQAWTISAVLANMFGQGFMLSYTTSLLPALQDPESPIRTDLHTASWISSVCGIAGIPGFLISSTLMDMFGRKLAHLIVVLPAIAGWLAIYAAQDIPTIMIGRILKGITAGATVSLGAIVIGEYSSPKYRGVFLNLKTASVCIGGMCGHILSHFLTWRIVALIGVLPCIIATLIVITWPESPAWLASRGEFEKSEKSFFWLRKNSVASRKELEELIRAQKERLSKPMEEKPLKDKIIDMLTKFTRRDFLKPFFIVIISFTALEASGRHLFPAYALQIINEVTGSNSQSFYYMLGIDLIITTSAVCSSILVKIMKRRILLFSTGFAAVAVLMIVCVYLSLSANNIISNDHQWIPSSIFVLYFILANLGCTPIPLALLGELFPLPHRGVGSAIAGIWMSLCVMAALQITPYLLLHTKVQGTFFIYGIIMGLMLFILLFILPETKDKTLQEIEDYFNHGSFRNNDKDDNEEVKVKIITDSGAVEEKM